MSTRSRIIWPELLENSDGANINGPSCIAVPSWCKPKLGNYYLYFSHHRGSYIRLATANNLFGPWNIFQNGVLNLSQVLQCEDHIASPDVIVDEQSREIWMYFHGVDKDSGRQLTYFANSKDGLNFNVQRKPIAPFYLKVVKWRDLWIGMSKGGQLLFSENGRDDFRTFFTPAFPMSGPLANASGDVRHVALSIEDDRLWVLFSRIGDAPEHIRIGYIDLLRPKKEWKVEFSVPLLVPKYPWEGANLPMTASLAGAARNKENALRDPALLKTENGYALFYSYAGESGIGYVALPKLSECLIDRPWIEHWKQETPCNDKSEELRFQLRVLAQPGNLNRRLIKFDNEAIRQRIYIMGCGRSGTWLLTALMECFDDVQLIAKELPAEAFGLKKGTKKTLIIKRTYNSYRFIDSLPKSIGIIFLVRHPFDVLTSYNSTTGRKYHISVDRWNGEMNALKDTIEDNRPNTLAVRYEDLVKNPDVILSIIAEKFNLVKLKAADQVIKETNLPPNARNAMHGIRSIDQESVYRYLKNNETINDLRLIVPRLDTVLNYISEKFEYDISLPEPIGNEILDEDN